MNYKRRQKELIERVCERAAGVPAVVLVPAHCEGKGAFRQEENHWYLTGSNEPGTILALFSDGTSILFVPKYEGVRARWVSAELTPDASCCGVGAGTSSVDVIRYLGSRAQGYSFVPSGEAAEYGELIDVLKAFSDETGRIFVPRMPAPYPVSSAHAVTQLLVGHISASMGEGRIETCGDILADMRRTKDADEIAAIHEAISITLRAHEAASVATAAGVRECVIQAALESVYTSYGVVPAFESIVATGKNATVLHYTAHTGVVAAGDYVVVDIGASYQGYAADITRTYRVAGAGSSLGEQYYAWVAQCQDYIASVARPGMYIRSKTHPELSLQNLTEQFFAERGVRDLFCHAIGHYMGLAVHDVGTYETPLRPGDVITIEPGLYDSAAGIGIRIEDDYLITETGCVPLSK